MKGQMFIMAAILVISGVVLVYSIIGLPSIAEEKKFQDSMLLDKTARNVMNEYIYAMGASTIYGEPNASAEVFLANLSAFVKSDTDSEMFYSVIFVNGTTSSISVNTGNFLDATTGVTISLTNSTPSSATLSLANGANGTLYFMRNINGTMNFSITYTKDSESVTETFPLTAGTSNLMQGFFDITLRSSNSKINLIETYNRSW